MDESVRQEIALFRYGLIAPLVNGQVDRTSYLKEVSTRMHWVPHYGEKRIAAKTILDWCTQYKKGGFEALKPKRRSDRGHSRRLSPEDEDHILTLRKKLPHMPVTVFYQHLIEQGEIETQLVSYFTIYRLCKNTTSWGKKFYRFLNENGLRTIESMSYGKGICPMVQ